MGRGRGTASTPNGERGAALIIALGMLTLLLVIAVTFFRASRDDVRTADNAVNAVRAELLADGATAVAIAFINHDHNAHPSLTSIDHAWRVYFNGAWMVGKPWMWAPLQDPTLLPTDPNFIHRLSPLRKGIPELNLALLTPQFEFRDSVYIPRVDYAFNAAFGYIPGVQPEAYRTFDPDNGELVNPFVTTLDVADPTDPTRFPPIMGLVSDLGGSLTFLADVDSLTARVYDALAPGGRLITLITTVNPNANPPVINRTLPAEQIHFWTDVDNDGDGLRDSMWLPVGADRYFPEDGLDNDLDGFIDEFDLDGEPGVFLYRGDTDGIDNDGDGFVDEDDEFRFVIFTVATPFVARDPLTGELFAVPPTAAELQAMGIDPGNDTVLFEGAVDPNTGQFIAPIGFGRSNNPIYMRDNDYDLVMNDNDDASRYMLTPDAVNALATGDSTYPYYNLLLNVVGQQRIDEYNFGGRLGPLEPAGQIRGETVTELVGRIAILINDESSKLNLNAAGGLTYLIDPPDPPGPQFPMARAFNRGVGPHEAELRILSGIGQPGIGQVHSNRMWTYRTGGTGGDGFASAFYSGSLDPTADVDNTFYDVSLPGYGRVDDNANLLQLALNRIDDRGIGVQDDGLFTLDFEGIDEPGELQRFRPYRNRIAEQDGSDNDEDDIPDEIGELGDRFYKTHHEIKILNQIGPSIFDDLDNVITVHSFDRNERHFHQDQALGDFGGTQERRTTGLRKDLNVARPDQVARAVTRDWTYAPSRLELREDFGFTIGALPDPPQLPGIDPLSARFLDGLRQENVSVFTSQPIFGVTPPAGFATALLADAELRAHQVATSIKDFADLDSTRSVDRDLFVDDRWWQLNAEEAINTNPELAGLVGTKRIRYTFAGAERIRINEINVRPVRRFESEARTLIGAPGYDPGLDPNRFVPGGGSLTPEQIEDQGFRLRTRTTLDAIAGYEDETGTNLVIEPGDLTSSWSVLDPFGLLGLSAAWRTYRSYLDVRDPNTEREFRIPDVVQFSFQATDELPGGHHYLKANTQFIDGNDLFESVTRRGDLAFAVKIGTLANDWFTDLVNIDSFVRGNRVYTQAWRTPAAIGAEDLGGSLGWAFLQGGNVFRALNTAFAAYSSTPEEFLDNNILEPNLGYTIQVPPRTGAPLPENDLWVHVAVMSLQPDEDVLAVNAFEFSQEPDHEWVEVVNLDPGNAVDLSRWTLRVENHPLGFGAMTVPAGTTIAPGGSLLLGTNKFDYGFNSNYDPVAPIAQIPGDASDPFDPDLFDRGAGFFANGIGLASFAMAASAIAPDPTPANMAPFTGVTVPRSFYRVGNLAAVDTGSVFEGLIRDRVNEPFVLVDLVDRDGDGLEDGDNATADDLVVSTPFGDNLASSPSLLDTGADQPKKPWDRIVELIIPDLVPQPVPPFPRIPFSAGEIGRIVLGGGIFPNNPEFDLVDNDGDNAVLAGIPGGALGDLIDNDFDGEVDETDEGIDEGQFALDQRALVDPDFPVPGSYSQNMPVYLSLFFNFDPAAGPVPAYWNAALNPPQWKEFIERRNFPGDNVIVTLFEGPAADNRVADRITYSQRDIDNRALDDILPVGDFDTDGFGEQAVGAPGVPVPLNPSLATFWGDNTMGIDFARSLERKLPTYTGDRFGVQNRFQATDGNYDDWSDSTGRWERQVSIDPVTRTWTAVNGVLDRLDVINGVYTPFAHTISGTPLRANVPARIAAPADTPRGDVFRLAEFPNHPLVSPGDALRMPHTSRLERMDVFTDAGGAQFLMDLNSTNTAYDDSDPSTPPYEDRTYDSALLAQRFDDTASPVNYFHDARSFIGDLGTTDSVSLNVGQANVIQFEREPGLDDADPAEIWQLPLGNSTVVPPQAWAPLMAFEVDGLQADAGIGTVPPYDYERQYLFQPPGTLPATVDNTRWPMPSRAVLYASRNFNDFAPSNPVDGATALFVWDGDDGVENGEYDLYVVTTEDLGELRRADNILFVNEAARLLTAVDDPPGAVPPGFDTGVGLPFVNAADRTANREVFLDIEVFRDLNGDRVCWSGGAIAAGDTLTDSAMNRGQAVGVPFESFGRITAAQPDPDGMIHYGVVRVENNFLAVLVRNRSAAGRIARISRVILAARNKTPGRLNINTVESTRIALPANPGDPDDLPEFFYNPLQGLPGVLRRPPEDSNLNLVATGVGGRRLDFGFYADPNLAPTIHVQALANQIVNQRVRLLGEQPDGRYYELTSDLLADAHFAQDDSGTALRPPLVADSDSFLPDSLPAPDGIVDANANRSGAINEATFRFRRMQNLITTQANVYEILVTVQAGYGVDNNGDGRINWRDDNEFTVLAEKSARTIYER